MKPILFFITTFFLLLNSNAQEWVDIRTTKFGKQTLYRDIDNKSLTGHFKMATSYDGRYSEINIIKGKLEGERKDFNKEGILVKSENYKEGFLDGKTTLYYASGTIKREMVYSNGVKNGTTKGYNLKGEEVAVEEHKKGVKTGKWIFKQKQFNSKKYNTTTKYYTNGKPTGTWKQVNEKNKPIWIKKHTTPTHYKKQEYFANGKLKKEFIKKDGKSYKTAKEYYSTGVLKNKYVYKDGKYTYRLDNYEDGTPKFIGNYKNGTSHGEHIQHNNNGVITMKGNYFEGKRTGEWILNTTRKKIITYKNGKKNGVEKIYSSDGKLFSEGTYVNNIKDGVWKFYNKQQDVTREVNYKRGKRLSEKKY